MTKVLVCGGREYDQDEVVKWILDLLTPSEIVHGDAAGADSLASEWASNNNVPQVAYPAQWHAHGRAAGPIRNQLMLDENEDIELVVGFAGGKGTQDMLARAQAAGILTLHVR